MTKTLAFVRSVHSILPIRWLWQVWESFVQAGGLDARVLGNMKIIAASKYPQFNLYTANLIGGRPGESDSTDANWETSYQQTWNSTWWGNFYHDWPWRVPLLAPMSRGFVNLWFVDLLPLHQKGYLQQVYLPILTYRTFHPVVKSEIQSLWNVNVIE